MMNTEKYELNELKLDNVNAGTGCVIGRRKHTSASNGVRKTPVEANNLLMHGDVEHTSETLPAIMGRHGETKKSMTGVMC